MAYNPAQPRSPGGMPTGGQWTGTGNPAVMRPKKGGFLVRAIASHNQGVIDRFLRKQGPRSVNRQKALRRARWKS